MDSCIPTLRANRLESFPGAIDHRAGGRVDTDRSPGSAAVHTPARRFGISRGPGSWDGGPGCPPYREGAEYRYCLGGHQLILAFRGVKRPVEVAVGRAEAEFALVVEGPLLVIGYRFGDVIPWSWAAPYNWHFAPAVERVVPASIPLTPDTYSRLWATLWISLEDLDEGRVQVRRAVALRPEFMQVLHGELRTQSLRPFHGAAADRARDRLGSGSPALLDRALVRTKCAAVSAGEIRRDRNEQHARLGGGPRQRSITHDRNGGARVVIGDGFWGHIRRVRAYHRLFPEIRGDGRSRADAIAHLANQLARAQDFAPGRAGRESIDRALADIRALVDDASGR